MALRWIDGFDHYGPIGTEVLASGILRQRYPRGSAAQDSGIDCDIVEGREQGTGLNFQRNSAWFETPPIIEGDRTIIGIAVKRTTTSSFWLIAFRNIQGSSVSIRVTISGEIEARRGGTLLGTSAEVLPLTSPASWKYIEVNVRWGVNAGAVEVRVDGQTVLNLTGIQTGVIGEDYFDSVFLFSNAGTTTPHVHVDDLYICDATGATNNDFLGPQKVVTLFPASDVTTGFGVEPPTPHYQAMRTTLPDETSYVVSNTPGAFDIYGYDALPPYLDQPTGVQLCTTGRFDNDRFFDLIDLVRVNGTTYEGTTRRLSSGLQTSEWVLETNPSTGLPWTLSELEDIQAGLKVG